MRVYVGTYTRPILFGSGKVLQGKGEGIYLYTMDPRSGKLAFHSLTEAVNPSYVAFSSDGRFLYAVNELKSFQGEHSGAVSAFSIDRDGGLALLNQRPTRGTDPCHLSVDKSGSWVFVANFMSGSVCVFPAKRDGSLGEASDFVQHQGSSVDPARQRGPHAHSVTYDDSARLLFVPDLGLDRLVVYELEPRQGRLKVRDDLAAAVKPGSGPRHLVLHPNGEYAYLINELDSTITALALNRTRGALTSIQTVPTLPEGFHGPSTCADVQVTPDGAFLYGSNRGHDSVVAYRIDGATGTLSLIGHTLTGGRTPRSFAVDPGGRFLLVANQDTDTVVTFAVDQRTGKPEQTGHVTEVPTPVCVKFQMPAQA